MKSDFSSSNDLKLDISGIEGAEGTFPGTEVIRGAAIHVTVIPGTGISFQKLASSSN